jgi:trehalose 6-phosphate phosphatase
MDLSGSMPGLESLGGLFSSFGRPKPILVSDYDGTLAPFRRERGDAVPLPEVKELLWRIISAGGDVMILSGRDAGEVFLLLGLDVEIIGCHGWQRRSPGGKTETLPLSGDERRAVQALSSLFDAFPIDSVEIKPVSAALHWRERDEIKRRWHKLEPEIIDRAGQSGLEALRFNGGIEFRIPAFSKGAAIERILEHRKENGPVFYLGDDVTDEDAFLALKGRGTGILVSGSPRRSAADAWIRPEEVKFFLEMLLSALEGEQRRGEA